MLQLGPTMYFGELALLRNEPRAATVRARTNVSVLSLSRAHFTAIVGQIQGEMLQHADAYQPLSTPGKQVGAAALLGGDVQAQAACLSGRGLLLVAAFTLDSHNWARNTGCSRCHGARQGMLQLALTSAAQLLAGPHVQ